MSRFDILGKDAAIDKIIRFVDSLEPIPTWHDWYVGVTDDVSRRLYEEHKALPNTSIYVSVDFPATARSVKKYLIEHYGMDGRPEDVEYLRFVYSFKKTANTDPPL